MTERTSERKFNGYCAAALAVGAALFVFYLTANLLYPFCGDDFLIQHQLRTMSPLDLIREAYWNWTFRLGNIVCSFLEACRSKVPFDILNSIMQPVIVYLACAVAADRRLVPTRPADAVLLIAGAGLSAFACRARDTVFWLPGATLYSWSAAVYLGTFCLLRYCEKRRISTPVRLAVLALAAFASGYTNENVALTGVLFFAVRAWRMPSRPVFVTLAGWLAGGILQFTTPGVVKRLASASQGEGMPGIAGMFAKLPEIAGFYLAATAVPLAFAVLFWLVFRRRLTRSALLRAAVPLGLSGFAALVFAGCPLPPMRSYYVCGLLASIACLTVLDRAEIPDRARCLAALAVLAAGGAMFLSSLPSFIRIHEDETARIRLIEDARRRQVRDVTVPEHRVRRQWFYQYIFMEDITSDPDFWLNRIAADYYGVASIRSTPSGAPPPPFRQRFMRFLHLE